MANIAFPNVSMSSITCELNWPGNITHESIYTGSVQGISRGIGRWTGNFSFDIRNNQSADIPLLDAFLANLNGSVNTFDLPWELVSQRQQDAFPDGTDLRLTSITATGHTMRANFSEASGLLIGDRITINDQMFELISNLTAGLCILAPYRPLVIPTAGLAVNYRSPSVRARRQDSSVIPVNRTVDWTGPWVVPFVGVL